jgi:hypothetical protein
LRDLRNGIARREPIFSRDRSPGPTYQMSPVIRLDVRMSWPTDPDL